MLHNHCGTLSDHSVISVWRIAWKSHGIVLENLRYILTAAKISKSLRLRLLQASVIPTLLNGCESWKMTEKVERKLYGAVSKMLATIAGRTIQEESRNTTGNVVMKARDGRWSCAGHVQRMPENRLVHQVLFNCVRPTHETLFADVPNINTENAAKLSKDRKQWSGSRPALALPTSIRVSCNKVSKIKVG